MAPTPAATPARAGFSRSCHAANAPGLRKIAQNCLARVGRSPTHNAPLICRNLGINTGEPEICRKFLGRMIYGGPGQNASRGLNRHSEIQAAACWTCALGRRTVLLRRPGRNLRVQRRKKPPNQQRRKRRPQKSRPSQKCFNEKFRSARSWPFRGQAPRSKTQRAAAPLRRRSHAFSSGVSTGARFWASGVRSLWSASSGYYAAFLPPTSEWQVPARPPNVKIVAGTVKLIANRGDTGGEAVSPGATAALPGQRCHCH